MDRTDGPIQIPEGYTVETFANANEGELRALVEQDGQLTDRQWQEYRDRALPDGLFLLRHRPTGQAVATAGAIHNPGAGRYYFPFGGELGYLMVDTRHRRKGLGRAVTLLVVKRFLAAGYRNIRVGVQGFRLPAIRTYLGGGFVPFLHEPTLADRWRRICKMTDQPFEPQNWPTELE